MVATEYASTVCHQMARRGNYVLFYHFPTPFAMKNSQKSSGSSRPPEGLNQYIEDSSLHILLIAPLRSALAEAADGEEEDDEADEEEAQQVGPEDIDADPLQKHTADDDQVVAKRVDEGQPLHRFRHVFDGEGEPGEEHGGEDEEEGAHHRLLLSLADGGDEEAEAERAHEEEGGPAEKEEEAPPDGDPEPEIGHGRYHRHVGETDQDEGAGLAEDELALADGGGDDLLHGADLLLADHGHA